MNEILNNTDFAERLIKLAKDFDTYDFLDNDGDNDEILEQNIRSIEADLVNHNDTWIRDWINDIKIELKNKINLDDPDYLGQFLTECDKLLQYLDN